MADMQEVLVQIHCLGITPNVQGAILFLAIGKFNNEQVMLVIDYRYNKQGFDKDCSNLM